MTLMQTLPWGSVLSQMTEVHAGFLMMMRSASERTCYHNAAIVSEKSQLCNCVKAEDICVVECSLVMPAAHMHLQ